MTITGRLRYRYYTSSKAYAHGVLGVSPDTAIRHALLGGGLLGRLRRPATRSEPGAPRLLAVIGIGSDAIKNCAETANPITKCDCIRSYGRS